ncbi:MAG: Crp/Fnr family transcriptional regulator [Parvibaculum sp.]|uniref:cyclic nucleotide-binding domain-containing protein n=1 Tax=Parvibaculum sp. TaxID=2024848 RepID=UPI002717E3DF|nr:Crp/Fnr family transcriptional regulator [Parvibaculum sp.]MDO8837599.1 Crp/Fnr family transcriptional regulator [Parvibaculum sp.]
MSLEPAIALLKRLELFSGLDPVRLEVLTFTCERREYAPGATLFEAGDEADCAFLILDGEAAMLARNESGAAQALRLESGDLIGETALFEPRRRLTTVRAVSSLLVLRIGRDMFQRLIGEFPEMAGAVASRLAERLSTLGDELSALGGRLEGNQNGTKRGRGIDE